MLVIGSLPRNVERARVSDVAAIGRYRAHQLKLPSRCVCHCHRLTGGQEAWAPAQELNW
jgi:hypothetical protein